VHPTLGSLRDLQAFFWLQVFSTSQTLSTPAPARVTQTVGTPLAKQKPVREIQLKRSKISGGKKE